MRSVGIKHHTHTLTSTPAQRPVTVGIPCYFEQMRDAQMGGGYLKNFIDAVTAAKGQPKLIEMSNTPPADILKDVDALLIPGGSDVNPPLYGEERRAVCKTSKPEFDAFEINLIREAYARNVPMLGICRGQQLMNVAAGGTLYQDINTEALQRTVAIEHDYTKSHNQAVREDERQPVHFARLARDGEPNAMADSNLRRLFGFPDKFAVNSAHHQAIKGLGPIFAVTAWAMDGMVEGIQRIDNHTQWAVQWHPERQCFLEPTWYRMFEKLVTDGSKYRYGDVQVVEAAQSSGRKRKPKGVTVQASSENPWAPISQQLFRGLPGD